MHPSEKASEWYSVLFVFSKTLSFRLVVIIFKVSSQFNTPTLFAEDTRKYSLLCFVFSNCNKQVIFSYIYTKRHRLRLSLKLCFGSGSSQTLFSSAKHPFSLSVKVCFLSEVAWIKRHDRNFKPVIPSLDVVYGFFHWKVHNCNDCGFLHVTEY